MHQRRQSGADKHQALVDAVKHMIEIIAVYRTLMLAHTGERTVQRISKPVDYKSKRGQPKEIYIPGGKHKSGRNDHRTDKADCRQQIGGSPLGESFRYPYQNLFLYSIQK